MAITDNLLAFYNLGESSGDRLDSGPNGLHLSLTGTESGNATGRIGNGWASVSSSTTYLRNDSSTWQTFSDFTVTGWFYLTATPATNGATYVLTNNGGLGNGTNGFHIRVVNLSGTINARIQGKYGGFSTGLATHGTSIGTGAWYFVACTYTASTKALTININNGTPASSTTTNVIQFEAYTKIGSDGASPHTSPAGTLDLFGFWNRVLSSDELTTLYNSGNGYDPYAATGSAVNLCLLGVGS